MMRSVLFLSAAAFAAPSLALAQGVAPAAPVSELTVTAQRAATAASPYSTAVVGQQRLSGADGVADALGDVGDLYIQAPGGRSGFGSLFLRGADPNFTAVLLDGVPLNNPTNTRGGAANISEMGTAALERVEVVAGPLSSLYGSGALAGAVNLVVAGGAASSTGRLSAGLGTEGDYSVAAQLRGPLAAGYGGSLTFEAADDGETTLASNFASQTLTGKLARLEGEGGKLVFRLMRTEADTFPDNSGGPLFAALRTTERREGREGLIGGALPLVVRDHYRFDLSASYLDRKDETTSPGVAPSAFDDFGVPQGEDSTTYRRGLVQGLAAFDLAGWKAVTGLEAQQERARSQGHLVFFGFPAPSGFSGDRTTVSAFAEAAREIGDLTVDAGLRADDVEALGTHVTGRVGARLAFGEGLALRASFGTGFKAPSFYALSNPFVGNPDLDPETSTATEVGLDWTGGRAQAGVAVFHSRYEDLIDFIPGPVPRLDNRNRVVSEGVSAKAAWRWSERLAASVQGQFADTTDEETGETLLNRPKWRVSSALTWTPAETLSLSLRHIYVGERKDYATPTGPRELEAYGALALDAAWTFLPKTTARLVVDNLLDEDYQAAIGFPGPGARARLMLTRGF